MMLTRIAMTLGVVFSMSVAHAELIATPLPGDTRLVQFNYDEDNTFLLLTKPRAVTHVQFAPDEQMTSVAAGDTSQWELTPTKNRKNLFIKPRYEGLETSLTVLTDKRTYQFVVKSTGDGKKWYQRVSWQYPRELVLEDETKAGVVMPAVAPSTAAILPQGAITQIGGPRDVLAGIKPESLRFSYDIEGDAPFKPQIVFDDGKFTYIRMPAATQELPALFSVIEGQEFALVNYTVQGEYIVAQRLLDVAMLKLGRAEVRITKRQPKRGLFGFQRED